MAAEALIVARGLTKRFPAAHGTTEALKAVGLTVRAGRVTGLVGPDGAGKTTLLRLMAGLLKPDAGTVTVAGFDTIAAPEAARAALGYMPQQFGLYEDLSVAENLALHADLRDIPVAGRDAVFDRLYRFTGLKPFARRLAGQLSGGMKQKLGLACALIRKPRVLLLDEPSVGVDPVSRRELWDMVDSLIDDGIAVVWSTAYLDEAERCAEVILLNEGEVLHDGPPDALTATVAGRTVAVMGATNRLAVQDAARDGGRVVDAQIQGRGIRLVLAAGAAPPTPAELGDPEVAVEATAPRFEDAFVALLRARQPDAASWSETRRALSHGEAGTDAGPAIEVAGLTKTFGNFTAVDGVDFAIPRGQVFGLLGPNGAGKSTTFRMLAGLLPASGGSARVAGIDLAHAPAEARARLGYVAQTFSLYGYLSVLHNLRFFAGAYGLPRRRARDAVDRVIDSFHLGPYLDDDAADLPLGFKRRLALAVAVLHEPDILFLDEPTSGVDPLTRREFWDRINAMAHAGVTVLVTTHFMDEAEYCDRVALMNAGKVLALGPPGALKDAARADGEDDLTLEEAFIRSIEKSARTGGGEAAA